MVIANLSTYLLQYYIIIIEQKVTIVLYRNKNYEYSREFSKTQIVINN